ncbi:MAG: hypothetical protein ACPG43_09895 [Alcanivoracaceae bacterium]
MRASLIFLVLLTLTACTENNNPSDGSAPGGPATGRVYELVDPLAGGTLSDGGLLVGPDIASPWNLGSIAVQVPDTGGTTVMLELQTSAEVLGTGSQDWGARVAVYRPEGFQDIGRIPTDWTPTQVGDTADFDALLFDNNPPAGLVVYQPHAVVYGAGNLGRFTDYRLRVTVIAPDQTLACSQQPCIHPPLEVEHGPED